MFENREAYLKFRRDWRLSYRVLTAEVRDLKIATKNKARAGEIVSAEMKKLHRLHLAAFQMCENLEDAKAAARSHRREAHDAA